MFGFLFFSKLNFDTESANFLGFIYIRNVDSQIADSLPLNI